MERQYAVLLDAGFLRRKLGTQAAPMTAQNVEDLVNKIKARAELLGMRLYRVFYYDAEPFTGTKTHPISNAVINFGATQMAIDCNTLLDELKVKPFFAVRLGELNFRGWKVSDAALQAGAGGTATINAHNVSPNLQQKGVDMRIALDISSMTLKNQADVFCLVTGDSDFAPIIKFARSEGKQVFTYTLGHRVKPSLPIHSDLHIPETYANL